MGHGAVEPKTKLARPTEEQPHDRREPLAARSVTQCAWAAAATKNCFLRDTFWRLTSNSGGRKAPAIVAVAHVMLVLLYEVLPTPQAFQDRPGPPLNEKQKQRMIHHHIRRLGKLGIGVRCTASLPIKTKPRSRPPGTSTGPHKPSTGK